MRRRLPCRGPGRRIPDVTAVDVDAPVLKRAQDRFAAAPVRWLQGDVMTVDLAGFDAVVSNAVLHHLPDTGAALQRFADLPSPGGTLAIVTFVRPSLGKGPWHLASWVACAVGLCTPHFPVPASGGCSTGAS
jgi:SAM-dependent methyltransferase